MAYQMHMLVSHRVVTMKFRRFVSIDVGSFVRLQPE